MVTHKDQALKLLIEVTTIGFFLAIIQAFVVGATAGESLIVGVFILWMVTLVAVAVVVYRLFYHVDTLILIRMESLAKQLNLGGQRRPPVLQELQERWGSQRTNNKRRRAQPQQEQRTGTRSPAELPEVENGLYQCTECMKSLHGHEKAVDHIQDQGHAVTFVHENG